MAWLPDGEKILMICLFVLAHLTNVTDRETDTQTRMTAKAALDASIARQKPLKSTVSKAEDKSNNTRASVWLWSTTPIISFMRYLSKIANFCIKRPR